MAHLTNIYDSLDFITIYLNTSHILNRHGAGFALPQALSIMCLNIECLHSRVFDRLNAAGASSKHIYFYPRNVILQTLLVAQIHDLMSTVAGRRIS
jgi:hypothetical protein